MAFNGGGLMQQWTSTANNNDDDETPRYQKTFLSDKKVKSNSDSISYHRMGETDNGPNTAL